VIVSPRYRVTSVVVSETFQGEPADFLNVRIVEVVDGRLTARLDGELSYATCAPALELLTDAINHGENKLILDLSPLGFCDSAGLRLLVQLAERTGKAGGWLRLAAPTELMLRILTVTNLHERLFIYPTLDHAVRDTDRIINGQGQYDADGVAKDSGQSSS
jgi:anti-sigma B factor antagonist